MKQKVAITMISVLLVFCMVGCSGKEETGKSSGSTGIINMGTGSVGGTDNVVVEALSSVVNSNTDLKTSTVTTSGGAEIIYLIEEGSVQGGYTGAIDLINALNGDVPFEKPVAAENMLQVFGFVRWSLPIVVLDSSSIMTYEDLAGKHIGLPPAASSTTAVLNLVLEAYDLTDKVTIDYFTWSEGYTALKDGRVDAFVGSYANGSPISGIVEIEATHKVRALNMSSEIGQEVRGMNPGVGIGELTNEHLKTIPAGETYLAPSNSGMIIFSDKVSEEDAYTYTKAAIDNLDALKNISKYFNSFKEVATSVCVDTVPFHKGAARALKEAGLWDNRFIVQE